MAYHSEGAFTQDILYDLPIYLRNFYSKLLIDVKENEKQQTDSASSSRPVPRMPSVPRVSK